MFLRTSALSMLSVKLRDFVVIKGSSTMNGKSKSGFRPQQKLIAAMLSVLLSANSAAAGNDLVEGLIGGV